MPSKSKRAPKAAAAYHHRDLRRALLDEAVAVLMETGTDDFTLRSLARRLGVSHAAPYAHFADKSALLEEIAAVGFVQLREAMLEASAPVVDSPRERMIAIGLGYIRFGLEHPAHYRLMFTAAEVCGPNKPEIVERTGSACFQVLIDSLDALRPDAAERFGPNRPDAVAAWSLVHGLALLTIDQRQKYEMQTDAGLAISEAALRLLLSGLHPD